jgi:hypothetical protein
MSKQNFNTSITVDNTPQEVFDAVANLRGWWSEEIKGNTQKQDEVFYYHFKDVHRCTIQLSEVIPGKRMVWKVLDNYFDFISDQQEWRNTKIIFDISKEGDKTKLNFTHEGLVPAYECYKICFDAWTGYIGKSLKDLITTGKGGPNPVEA